MVISAPGTNVSFASSMPNITYAGSLSQPLFEPASGAAGLVGDAASRGCGVGGDAAQPGHGGHVERAGWSRFETVLCRDGKTRRFESGSFPLAYGIPGRVGLLRGYGNAIVPQVAAHFVTAYLEATETANTVSGTDSR